MGEVDKAKPGPTFSVRFGLEWIWVPALICASADHQRELMAELLKSDQLQGALRSRVQANDSKLEAVWWIGFALFALIPLGSFLIQSRKAKAEAAA